MATLVVCEIMADRSGTPVEKAKSDNSLVEVTETRRCDPYMCYDLLPYRPGCRWPETKTAEVGSDLPYLCARPDRLSYMPPSNAISRLYRSHMDDYRGDSATTILKWGEKLGCQTHLTNQMVKSELAPGKPVRDTITCYFSAVNKVIGS